MSAKRALWVLEYRSDLWLFEHNPNTQVREGFPPFHLGGIFEMARGHSLIYGETKKDLMLTNAAAEWNLYFPKFKVKPVKIMLEWRYYQGRDRKAYRKGD